MIPEEMDDIELFHSTQKNETRFTSIFSSFVLRLCWARLRGRKRLLYSMRNKKWCLIDGINVELSLHVYFSALSCSRVSVDPSTDSQFYRFCLWSFQIIFPACWLVQYWRCGDFRLTNFWWWTWIKCRSYSTSNGQHLNVNIFQWRTFIDDVWRWLTSMIWKLSLAEFWNWKSTKLSNVNVGHHVYIWSQRWNCDNFSSSSTEFTKCNMIRLIEFFVI